MISEIVLLIGCITFYIIGRLSHNERESISDIKRKLRQIRNPVTPGPINYPTPEQSAYYGSEEEAADEDRARAAREAGLGDNPL